MVECRQSNRGVRPIVSVSILGRIAERGNAVYSPILGRIISRAKIEVDKEGEEGKKGREKEKETCDCVAYGRLAERLAEFNVGDELRADGRLKFYGDSCVIELFAIREAVRP